MKRVLIVLGIVCGLVLAGCDYPGQFEGKTAEEWQTQYNTANARNQGLQQQIDDLQNQNDDLQQKLNNLQDDYDSLKRCVRLWDNTSDCYAY